MGTENRAQDALRVSGGRTDTNGKDAGCNEIREYIRAFNETYRIARENASSVRCPCAHMRTRMHLRIAHAYTLLVLYIIYIIKIYSGQLMSIKFS